MTYAALQIINGAKESSANTSAEHIMKKMVTSYLLGRVLCSVSSQQWMFAGSWQWASVHGLLNKPCHSGIAFVSESNTVFPVNDSPWGKQRSLASGALGWLYNFYKDYSG